MAEEFKSNLVLDKTVQKVLDRERDYLEDLLIKEKKENSLKDEIIQGLRHDIDGLANQLQTVV